MSRKFKYALLALLLLSYPAWAAGTKLSQITGGGALNPATDQIVSVRSGATDLLTTVGTAAPENLATVVIDDGAGNLTIGSGVVTNAMLASTYLTKVPAFASSSNVFLTGVTGAGSFISAAGYSLPTFASSANVFINGVTAGGAFTSAQGVPTFASSSHVFLTGFSGAFLSAQPVCGDLSNAAASCSTDATNASNIGSGTLSSARLPATVLQSGATSGGDLSGTYPNPTVAKINGATLGTTTATSGNVLIGGGVNWATTALSGGATLASTGVVTLGNPSTTQLGGVNSFASTANNFLTGLSTGGTFMSARPACGNLSNSAASCSTDATVASNITSGNLPVAQLPTLASKNIWIGGTTNAAAAEPVTGDITLASSGATLVSAIRGVAVVGTTGTVNSVFSSGASLSNEALGTPASGTLTNATGLPLSTGVIGTLPLTNLTSSTRAVQTAVIMNCYGGL